MSEGLKGKYTTDWQKGKRKRPPLKSEILYAQSQTSTARGAAAYLNIAWSTYKRWAEYYGVYIHAKNNINPASFKKKSLGKRKEKLNDDLEFIFGGNRQNYPIAKLKRRMLMAGLLIEQCGLCGFSTRRPSDGKVPLLLGRKDGDSHNWKRENWEMRCFNCEFLVSGTANARILFEKNVDAEETSHIFEDTDLTMDDLHSIRNEAREEMKITSKSEQ